MQPMRLRVLWDVSIFKKSKSSKKVRFFFQFFDLFDLFDSFNFSIFQSTLNPYMEILEKKSKTRGITQRHFWKKNPTNFLKSGFRGVTQRHLWKKIQNILMDLYSIIMKIFSFRGITQRHLWKKIPHYWIFCSRNDAGLFPGIDTF